MSKWADYAIVAVRFNSVGTHIDRLRVRLDNGESLESEQDIARSAVIQNIESGTTYATAYKNTAGKWEMGRRVYVIAVNGIKFLKTLADNKTVDNLDNLPRF